MFPPNTAPTMASILTGQTAGVSNNGPLAPHQQPNGSAEEGAVSLNYYTPDDNSLACVQRDLPPKGNHQESCLTTLMMSFPCWNNPIIGVPGPQHPPEHNPFKQLNAYAENEIVPEDGLFAQALGPIGSKIHKPGVIGCGRQLAGSDSAITSCGRCKTSYGFKRCVDCNAILCVECLVNHSLNPLTKDHYIVNLGSSSPVGPVPISDRVTPAHILLTELCLHHKEILRFVCEDCSQMVCQECTLWKHKEHRTEVISDYSDQGLAKLRLAFASGQNGKQMIKTSIDRAVAYTQSIERDAIDVTQKIRKSMRHFLMCIEERERQLIDYVDAIRLQRVSTLSDQMIGLRSALSGLANNAEVLKDALDNRKNLNYLDLCNILTKSEHQMEQFSMVYKYLQPREESLMYMGPSFELLNDIRQQGVVKLSPTRFVVDDTLPESQQHQMQVPVQLHPLQSPPHLPHHSQQYHHQQHPHHSGGKGNSRRQSRNNSYQAPAQPLGPISTWDPNVAYQSLNTRNSPIAHMFSPSVIGHAITGSNFYVKIDLKQQCSNSFAFDGHGDGEVSRPWGLCVDRDGHIIVADRRNNRIQVFYPDGTFKLKFGTKGTTSGQFDLPAGICTDSDNRIIVVDKDNHRVQVFTVTGVFIIKFGNYGKECGQFQYPWDVAVNTVGEILVTDSRNHRIQMFNRDGHFLQRFCFDGLNHSNALNGVATPRGICFAPNGNIIVSDFENHRLILIDSTLSEVIGQQGQEGTGNLEFSRPSGVCCDDDGRVIVADSKNQRVMIYTANLEFLYKINIRSNHHLMMYNNGVDEKDRPSDVALLPDGRLVVMVETSPDARDTSNPQKTFVQIY